MLNKIGTPEQLHVIKSGFQFDTNLIVKKIIEATPEKTLTLDQLHDAVKSMGVVDYTADDMNEVVRLLQSSGVTVKSS